MKIITAIIIIGTIVRSLIVMPAATFPQYPVYGTEKLERRQDERVPSELRYMSKKMYYLKTGRILNNERNRRHQQNFWGKGVSTKVRYPVHLAAWEESRRVRRPAPGKTLLLGYACSTK